MRRRALASLPSIQSGARSQRNRHHHRVTVNQERSVAYLPMLVVFPGSGTYGQSKGQGLLPGLSTWRTNRAVPKRI